MVVNLKNQTLTDDQLKSGKIQKNILSETEYITLDLIERWNSNEQVFTISTSGSTGKPKKIKIHRNQLQYSAETTMKSLDPVHQFKSMLLCIPPTNIGGMMVVIRALIRGMDLQVLEPGTSGLEQIKDSFDLTSMVPLQFQYLMDHAPEVLNHFKNILIGGAPLPMAYQKRCAALSVTDCFQTYGMTETVSHIALKNLSKNEQVFTTIGDVLIDTDERSCLKLKGTITQNEWIKTNDIVEVRNEKSFNWRGRADFAINSGGIKIHPEEIEAHLSEQLTTPFFIGGLPDRRLGERAVLFIEGNTPPPVNYNSLDKYHRPKEVVMVPKFIYTVSGKINRLKTLETINP